MTGGISTFKDQIGHRTVVGEDKVALDRLFAGDCILSLGPSPKGHSIAAALVLVWYNMT